MRESIQWPSSPPGQSMCRLHMLTSHDDAESRVRMGLEKRVCGVAGLLSYNLYFSVCFFRQNNIFFTTNQQTILSVMASQRSKQ
jgi:hypothetical protein